MTTITPTAGDIGEKPERWEIEPMPETVPVPEPSTPQRVPA